MHPNLRLALSRVAEGGYLIGVDAFRYQGDPTFVTAVRFWFDEYRVTFLAGEDEDALTADCGAVAVEDEGHWVDLSSEPVWSDCVGSLVTWAWCMMNDHGYSDAVRVEFERPNDRKARVIEFVVVASAFRFFESLEF
jgi:hypothetical protein